MVYKKQLIILELVLPTTIPPVICCGLHPKLIYEVLLYTFLTRSNPEPVPLASYALKQKYISVALDSVNSSVLSFPELTVFCLWQVMMIALLLLSCQLWNSYLQGACLPPKVWKTSPHIQVTQPRTSFLKCRWLMMSVHYFLQNKRSDRGCNYMAMKCD